MFSSLSLFTQIKSKSMTHLDRIQPQINISMNDNLSKVSEADSNVETDNL